MKNRPIVLVILPVLMLAPLFSLVLNDVDIPALHSVENTDQEVSAEATLEMAYSEAIGSDNDTYHFQPNGAGYTTRNPDHNLTVDVTADSLTIAINDDTWQLASNQAAESFTVEDNRLTIHRDGYDEWYVNGPVGLQQGFTLYEPSNISFDIGGTLLTKATANSLSIGDALNFGGLMAYDADGESVPVEFELENDKLAYAYDDVGAVYPLTIDPWVKQAELLPADVTAGNQIGWKVAVSNDTALIGAHRQSCVAGSRCGSVYVFVYNGTIWSQQAKLTANDADAGDEFGRHVALDGNTALVGAYRDDCVGGLDCGSTYVFTRSGNIWSQQAKLTANDAASDDEFGYTVAVQGDTALIASINDDDYGLDSGSVYVFTRSGSIWSQQAKLTSSNAAQGDAFGSSVALDGETALIGAYSSDCAHGDDCGSAYVFTRSGTMWSEQAVLTAPDFAHKDIFGNSVALSGNTALVAAKYDDDNGLGSGSVYVFTRNGTLWSYQAKLTAEEYGAFDNFGNSVAIHGDTAVIGSIWDDDNGGDTGSAFVFVRVGITWSRQAKLFGNADPEGENFGAAVSISENTIVVGAPYDDSNGNNSGNAFVFLLQPDQTMAATAACNDSNLNVTISAGDGPFNITASAGINTPVNGVGIGTTTINGPEKWDNLTVAETSGDLESINLGQFKCRTDERPVPLTPAHRSRTTNPFPTFSWTGISGASNYRVFVFDDKVVANRTVDIRQNSGGPTMMQLSIPLPDGRLFWRVRGRQNRVWSLWSVRFTLFKDPVAPLTNPTPVPTIDLNDAPTTESQPTVIAPTFPAPPNSR